MYRITCAVALAIPLLLFGSTITPISHAQQSHSRPVARGAMTITVDPAVKAFEIASSATQTPPDWMSPAFDDSAWGQAAPVWSDTQTCLSQFVDGWGSLPGYWGKNADSTYLFRRTFTLPPMTSFAGSVLTVGASFGDTLSVYLNGQPVMVRHTTFIAQGAVSQFLKPGKNVLAISVDPAALRTAGLTYGNSPRCSALTFSLTASPSPVRPSPLPGSAVQGSTLTLAWTPVDHAASYYLQVWMIQPFETQASTTPVVRTFTTQVAATHYALSIQSLPHGVYAWRVAALTAKGALLSPWSTEQSVTLR